MTDRSQRWFRDAIAAGMDHLTALMGTEIIDSWEQFWNHSISDENLQRMKDFGLDFQEAALHRWSIQAGPRPWVPDDPTLEKLKSNPRWSSVDDREEQRKKKRSTGKLTRNHGH